MGRGNSQALRDSVQPEALGGAALRNGDVLVGWPRAAAGPGRDDRGRSRSQAPSHGPKREIRLSAQRRVSEFDGWLPSAPAVRAEAELPGSADLTFGSAHPDARWRGAPLRESDQHHAFAGLDSDDGDGSSAPGS